MGLAPLVVVELFEVVRQLAGEGITIVLAEQFVHTALELATEGAIVVHGRVEHVGCARGAAQLQPAPTWRTQAASRLFRIRHQLGS